jgi:hypothetical protein
MKPPNPDAHTIAPSAAADNPGTRGRKGSSPIKIQLHEAASCADGERRPYLALRKTEPENSHGGYASPLEAKPERFFELCNGLLHNGGSVVQQPSNREVWTV